MKGSGNKLRTKSSQTQPKFFANWVRVIREGIFPYLFLHFIFITENNLTVFNIGFDQGGGPPTLGASSSILSTTPARAGQS